MKNLSYALAILFATSAPTYAQTGLTGTWRAETTPPWTVVLRVDGPRVTGMVSSCASPAANIYDGQMDSGTITFKCGGVKSDRAITFRGTISADEIAFTWELRVRDGVSAAAGAAGNGMFGATFPARFTAKRVPDDWLAEIVDQVRGVELAAAVNLVQKDVKVEGTLFLPRAVGRVRAVVVVIKYGLGFAGIYNDPQWQRLSQALDVAVLHFRISSISSESRAAVWNDAALGGADGLVLILQRLAQESGHREISDAPLLFWGHSAAGPFGATFAAIHPQRTIAFVRYHSGPATSDLKVVSQIPALFLVGGKDTDFPQGAIGAERLWKSGRSLNAPWTFAVEPEATHGDPRDVKKANDLVIPWIEAVLRQRLSPDGAVLRVVTDASAWVGNNRTGEVASYGTFPGSKVEASWLPDEPTARGWRAVLGVAK